MVAIENKPIHRKSIMKAKMVSYRVRRVNFRETESGQLRLLTKRIEPKKYRIALIHLS